MATKWVKDLTTGQLIEVEITPEEQALIDAQRTLDLADETDRQQRYTARETDFDELRAGKLTQLDQAIQAAIDNIDTDLATLPGVTSLAQLRPIINGLLNRQRGQLVIERRLVNVLKRMV